MVTLDNSGGLSRAGRGGIERTGEIKWMVRCASGIKRRKIIEFFYDFSEVKTIDLPDMLRYSARNSKLKKTEKEWSYHYARIRLWSFNLPALGACPGAGACASFCYALQGNFVRHGVLEVRASNYALLWELHDRGVKSPGRANHELVSMAISRMLDRAEAETPKGRHPWFRIHDSGDFFAPWYMRAWREAINRCPHETRAHAYTKAIPALNDQRGTTPRLYLVLTVGGIYDKRINTDLPHSRVFATHGEMVAAGDVDGSATDVPAMLGARKIGLVYHGTEKLEVA